MTYVLIGVVGAVLASVLTRWLTLKAVARLAKEAGASGAMRDELLARETRRATADRKRRPLAVRGLGGAWRDLWIRRSAGR